MKACIQGIILCLYNLTCFAQKPPIDSNAFNKWTAVRGSQISNNGLYALYSIEDLSPGSRDLVVLGTKNNWKLKIPNSYGQFTSNSKYVIFRKGRDSLGILQTGGGIVHYIPFVQSYAISRNGSPKVLVYQLNDSNRTLAVYDLDAGKEKLFEFVKQYQLSEDGSTLLFITEEKKDTKTQALQWLDLASGVMKSVWQGSGVGSFVINKSNKQLAFTVDRPLDSQTERSIWYFKNGMDKAIELPASQAIKNETTLQLDRVASFSDNDSCLFILLKEKSTPKPLPASVDVWSYTDLMLQSVQLNDIHPKTFQGVINLQSAHFIRLEHENEMIMPPALEGSNTTDYRLVLHTPGDMHEVDWNARAFVSVSLVSVKDGIRKMIPGFNGMQAKISPLGNYVVYFDPKQKNYFSYEIKTGITHNLTKDIHVLWTGYTKDLPTSDNAARGFAAWLTNDEGVLVYDENDIWRLDMAGKKMPVNLTNGYGKTHHVVFCLELLHYKRKAVSGSERIIINAFNIESKDNGYFAKTLNKPGDPELLSMGPYLYNIPDNPYLPVGSIATADKALNADMYLVRRMSATEAPNYFSTADFKTFKPLSDVHPQKEYNWLTAELVTWKGLDGRSLQGILYKPENFDSLKKYPVIFNYYERRSDGLHAFLHPDYSRDDINIPWYTSNGYLVFVPDIHYKIGETGESVINSVVSAAQYLSQMSWVNPGGMGIQGFSFGGYETNVLVAHSDIFAAACSASGISDLVSQYGGLYGRGGSLQSLVEFSQMRIGSSLWQRPDLYIKNSPIFNADQVTTPLLMMHTKQDGVCPFSNAIEFFTALRRLGKKVWLLQYEGNHFPAGDSYKDYSTRLAQFFDHYLRDAPAPKWMINGIPAKLKGIDLGLELMQE